LFETDLGELSAVLVTRTFLTRYRCHRL